jgi:hypothetical protein
MPLPTVVVTLGVGQSNNTLPNAGQTTSANSIPGVVASDQSTLPVTGIGGGSWVATQVSVATSATLLVAANPGRQAVVVINQGVTPIFLGGSGVTTSTGALLAGGNSSENG